MVIRFTFSLSTFIRLCHPNLKFLISPPPLRKRGHEKPANQAFELRGDVSKGKFNILLEIKEA